MPAYREFVKHPGPIVVGAVQGSSILGPVYEYAFLADADLKRRNIRGRVPITLVTPEPWPGHLGLGARCDEPRRGGGGTRRHPDQGDLQCPHAARGRRHDPCRRAQCGRQRESRSIRCRLPTRSIGRPSAACRRALGCRTWSTSADWSGWTNTCGVLPSQISLPSAYAWRSSVVDRTPLPVGAPDSVYSIQKDTVRRQSTTSSRACGGAVPGEQCAAARQVAVRHGRHRSGLPVGAASALARHQLDAPGPLGASGQGRFREVFRQQGAADAGRAGAFDRLADRRGDEPAAGGKKERGAGGPAATALKPAQSRWKFGCRGIPAFELRALAKSVGREPNELAAELLAAALIDAKSYLSDAAVDALELARRELLVEELPEHQPGVEFHGGGT